MRGLLLFLRCHKSSRRDLPLRLAVSLMALLAGILPGNVDAGQLATLRDKPVNKMVGIFDPEYHDGTKRALGRGDKNGRLPVLPAGRTLNRKFVIYNDSIGGNKLQLKVVPALYLSRTMRRKLTPVVREVTVPSGGQASLSVAIPVPNVTENVALELMLILSKQGKERFRDNLFFVVVPPGKMGTQVVFEGRDDQTQGDWVGVYGKQGFMVPVRLGRAVYQLPEIFLRRGSGFEQRPDAPFGDDFERQQQMLNLENTDTTTDKRVALRGPGPKERSPAAFVTENVPLLIRADTADGKPHRLSLYFLDYKREGRSQEISVYDLKGHRLDMRKITSYGEGSYLHYRFTGTVVVRVAALGKFDPTLSGLFVDEGSTEGMLYSNSSSAAAAK